MDSMFFNMDERGGCGRVRHFPDWKNGLSVVLGGASGCGLVVDVGRKMKEKRRKMTGNEYQVLAMRTCSIPYDQKKEMARHAVFGLASEAGEVAGILQKEYQGHEVDREHVKKELGDCMWMIAEACTAFGISLDDVMQTNINKLKSRYPEGFTAERSLHREEGDI